MAQNDIIISVVDRTAGAGPSTSANRVDYQPFGVKVLKLRVQRNQNSKPRLGPIWLHPQNYTPPDEQNSEPARWHAYGTADNDPDLWVAWGAGDERGFCMKMEEQLGNKKPAPIDDDAAHFVYLHLIHRPADPANHQLTPKILTVVATGDGGQGETAIFGQLTVHLDVPKGAVNPVRALWDWDVDAGRSAIRLGGMAGAPLQIARYFSRWWPTHQVVYTAVDSQTAAFLAGLKLIFKRRDNGSDRGRLELWHENSLLAKFSGELRLPVHDVRLCTVEALRFVNDVHLVIRIAFYWVQLGFSVDELMTFVPSDKQAAWQPQAEQLQKELGSGLIPWQKREEVPDIERVDIVLDMNNLAHKFAASDTHWKEFWGEVDQGEALDVRIASKRDIPAVLQQAWEARKHQNPVYDPLANGLCDVIMPPGVDCSFRPEGKVIYAFIVNAMPDQPYEICERCQTHFRGQKSVAVGKAWGKHAPMLKNFEIDDRLISNEVLEG